MGKPGRGKDSIMHKLAVTAIPLSALVFVLPACTTYETIPETGRRRPALQYTEAEMNQLGAEAYKEVLSKYTVIETGDDADMVRAVGQKVAQATGKDYEWEFKLLDAKDTINAFCLPGGKVAVFSGILPICQGEQGLAVVVSHEVAHATLEHGNERLSEPTWKRLAGIPVGAVTGVWGAISPYSRKFVMDGLGLGVLVGQVTPYNQVQESEADAVGLRYMYKAGFDVDEAAKFWRRMHEISKGQVSDSLSTHPGAVKRAKWLEREAQELKKKGLDEKGDAKTGGAKTE